MSVYRPFKGGQWLYFPVRPSARLVWFLLQRMGNQQQSRPFRVIAPKLGPVSILLLYPNYLVSVGDTITVRGSGFTPTGNTVQIGSAVVENLSSPDRHTIKVQAPAAGELGFIPGMKIYSATVTSASGQTNSISFADR
ncbi:MAG: hypothetical protein DMG37_15365 [Acidobacteria bacterium]|nr:MAG: hypothetical protein DMG37_15365 [Acidobacteriota bacterium]